MPSSRCDVIPFVLSTVSAIQPKSILDIGIGFGKYGVLFREYLDVWKVETSYHNRSVRIDGVEVCSAYENPVWAVYDNIYKENVLDILDKLKETQYDLVFLGDVIEHFDKEDGQKILDELSYKHIIIVTPLIVSEQAAVYNNKFETHKSSWKHQHLAQLELKIIGNQQVFYG